MLLFSVICGFLASVISLLRISRDFVNSEIKKQNSVNNNTKSELYNIEGIRDYNSTAYSMEEFELLARVISAESRGEPYIGQVAVGAVILNRVEHPSFPDTLKDVVYQKGAFSCVYDGQINKEITESAYNAARDAMKGADPSGGAIYFYNPKTATNKWLDSRAVIIQIGAHVFCK